jgi:hypothetical protein
LGTTLYCMPLTIRALSATFLTLSTTYWLSSLKPETR